MTAAERDAIGAVHLIASPGAYDATIERVAASIADTIGVPVTYRLSDKHQRQIFPSQFELPL